MKAKTILNKENWEKFHKDLEEFRGFNQEEWDELNPGLRTLIGLRTHIAGKGSALFKCIIQALTDHEKRLKGGEIMDEKLVELIKKNKGILKQLTFLNNEVKKLRGRVKALEKRDSCYPTKEEIKNFKVGGTD